MDLFFNIVFTVYLFGCACEFAYFHILTNMVNNKAGMQQGVMAVNGTLGSRE